ncbi:uncharacterized protein [Diadema setosum]|uniref:uncharacterized protein n=1 Tax=Diadema setosum TaxID=31175 RepID=UPI003B3BD594
MRVKCYDEISSMELVNGPSPQEGLVVLDPDTYLCPEGFNDRAAELICGRLGFPAVQQYWKETLPSTVARNGLIQLSCADGDVCLMECSLHTSGCPSNQGVKLKCREPGFLGCYQGSNQTLQFLFSYNENKFDVLSDDECVSTCRRKSGNHDIAVVHLKSCICFQSESFANIISGGSYSHQWICPSQDQLDSHHLFFSAFNLSLGFCDHPGHVSNGQWDSNITKFGSEITLNCGEGYVINGSTTLQCVAPPGKSTYFPVWNATVPSCRAVEDQAHGKKVDTLLGVLEASSQSKGDSDERRLQMSPTGTSTRIKPGTRDHVTSSDSTSIDPYAVGPSLPQFSGNEFGGVTTTQDIYQNISQSYIHETEESSERDDRSSADTRSRPSHDVIQRDGKGVAQKATNKKGLYMDMSGAVKKLRRRSFTFVQSRDTSGEWDEEDMDEHGYILDDVNLPKGTRCQPRTRRATMESFDNDNAPSSGSPTRVELSVHPIAVNDAGKSWNFQSSIYQEIPSTFFQSSPSIPETQYANLKYRNIDKDYKIGPLVLDLNDP